MTRSCSLGNLAAWYPCRAEVEGRDCPLLCIRSGVGRVGELLFQVIDFPAFPSRQYIHYDPGTDVPEALVFYGITPVTKLHPTVCPPRSELPTPTRLRIFTVSRAGHLHSQCSLLL